MSGLKEAAMKRFLFVLAAGAALILGTVTVTHYAADKASVVASPAND